MRKLFFYVLIASAFCGAALGQSSVTGKVIEVIDGRTFVIETRAGRVKAQLQYIDTPETEQPLYAVIKDHLSNIAFGKDVEFKPIGFSTALMVGRLSLGGIDVSAQMLRDGAAWHEPPSRTGQPSFEASEYDRNQSLAKNEKRGVWSIQGLKPAWEFREEKKAAAVFANAADANRSTDPAPEQKKRKGKWGDENPWLKNPGNILHGYNAESRTGFLSTTRLGVRDDAGANLGTRTAIEISYIYQEMGEKGRKGFFAITVLSAAQDARFLTSNSLRVQVDGKSFIVAKPVRDASDSEFGSFERLLYKVDRAIVEKVANGADVVIRIGNYYIEPTPGVQMLLHNMLQLSQ